MTKGGFLHSLQLPGGDLYQIMEVLCGWSYLGAVFFYYGDTILNE